VQVSLNYFGAQVFKFGDHYSFVGGKDITGGYTAIPILFSAKYNLSQGRFSPFAAIQLGVINTRCNYTVAPIYTQSGTETHYKANAFGLAGGIELGIAFNKSEKISWTLSAPYLKGSNKHTFDKTASEFNCGFNGTEFYWNQYRIDQAFENNQVFALIEFT